MSMRLHRKDSPELSDVILPNGSKVSLASGRKNTLIKAIIEKFYPVFAPGGLVAYIGGARNKCVHMQADHFASLGVTINPVAKMPDVIIHHSARNWLMVIEAVTSDGPVNAKRRKELTELFSGCKAGLIFVTAFESRLAMLPFLSEIAWESEVWIAEDPAHMIHFNGARFLGPYPGDLPQ